MEREISLRIVVERPPSGVYFGLQKGSGSEHETVQTVESKSDDLQFEFNVRVREGKREGVPLNVERLVQRRIGVGGPRAI